MSCPSSPRSIAALCALPALLAVAACGGHGHGEAPAPATLTSIEVTPSPATLVVNRTLQLRATGHYSDGTKADLTGSVAWTSSDPASVTVDVLGMARPAAGVSPGASSTLKAETGALSATSLVTVDPAAATFSLLSTDDPLASEEWHLRNTGQTGYADVGGTPGEDVHVEPVFSSLGISGKGVRVAIVDSGLEIAHEDLAANVVPQGSWNFRLRDTDPTNPYVRGDHGTSVAGLVGMVQGDGKGGVGAAPGVELVGYNALAGSGSNADFVAALGGSHASPDSASVAVFNQSWGVAIPTSPSAGLDGQYQAGTHTLRGGLGAVYVKAAGNYFQDAYGDPDSYCAAAYRNGLPCLGTYGDPGDTSPYNVTVGALDANGVHAIYSSAGPALWIASPGGLFGANADVVAGLGLGSTPPAYVYEPALVTTDQSGCDQGFARTTNGDPVDLAWNHFGLGAPPNESCNYTSDMNGTSGATPVLAGIVALLLEANPSLGWRDVKHILATTARKVDPDRAPVVLTLGHGSYVAEPGWTTNAAGHPFHDWYGFGAVDAAAAVNAALSYPHGQLGAFVDTGWLSSASLSIHIPDDDAAGATTSLNATGGLVVETAVLVVGVAHTKMSELAVELVSPSGTRSVLKAPLDGLSVSLNAMRLGSNAFYGEPADGAWTVRVVDANDPLPPSPPGPGSCDGTVDQPEACRFQPTNTTGGTLLHVQLKIYGHAAGASPLVASREGASPDLPIVSTGPAFRHPARAARLAALPWGATLESTAGTRRHLPTVRALVLAPGERVDDALAGVGRDRAAVVEQVGTWLLYREDATETARVVKRAGRRAVPVLAAPDGRLGIAPGTLRVALAPGGSAEAVASRAGLTVHREFQDRGVAWLDVPDGMDLGEAASRARAVSGVISAAVEVLDAPMVPF
ncbi:MAG TPA: S8 family serine peptidase [Vicinamibacteria bacterium]|nr:S8 family serine peptidase [Vicinamibacteria bacterium]